MRVALVAALVLGTTVASTAVTQGEDETQQRELKPPDRWDQVKLAVARHHVGSHGIPFYQSLSWWADERDGRTGPGPVERLAIEGDAVDALSLAPKSAVHIWGALATSLEIGTHSAVVIGGSLTRDARIVTDGIVAVHIQGDLDGVVECHGSTGIWVGGDLRGQVLTGHPSTNLHVKGDLEGVVRPVLGGGLLSIDVSGYAASSVLSAIDSYGYTSLTIAVAGSDLDPGIHPLHGRHGFLAVTGSAP